MDVSTITLVIAVMTIILFATEKVPLPVTALLTPCALVVSGVLTVPQAFAGFSSNTVMLLIGIMIMGEACFATGIAGAIGKVLLSLAHDNEKRLTLILYGSCALLSIFFNAMVIVAVFMPILDSIAAQSSTITRKYTYFPMVLGSVYGGNLSLVGATCMINASALLEASPFGRGFAFFEPFPVAVLGCVMNGLFLFFWGYRLQKRWFNFPETAVAALAETPKQPQDVPRWKKVVVWATLALCVLLFITQPIDFGVTALLGACVLMLTGCIQPEAALRSVSWSTILIVVGSLGLAKGLELSGAGQIMADAVISLCGPLGSSPFAMCVVICVMASLLSNFMSDNGATAITVPIALNVALSLGADPLPFVMACPIGAVIATATPVCKAPVTVTTVVGYRFKDYVRLGGACNVIALVCTAVSLYILYFR